MTKKYLDVHSTILEGGCGNGQTVWTLQKAYFDVYGIDFAKKTVRFLNKEYPELKITYADVRKLPFSNDYFNGYWSLGVIEHFKEGYDNIIKGAYRIIRKDGFLFISFPVLSLLRRIKIIFNKYPEFNGNYNNFYQFILNKKDVIQRIEKYGFKLIDIVYYDAIKGLKDEIILFNFILNKIYSSNNFYLKIIRRGINILCKNFSAHMCLLIMKKM